jgi:hypothetical protein
MIDDAEFNWWTQKWLASGQSMEDFLVLANANGLPFNDMFEIHREFLVHKARKHIKTWGPAGGKKCSDAMLETYKRLQEGAYYLLMYLENLEEWEDDNS